MLYAGDATMRESLQNLLQRGQLKHIHQVSFLCGDIARILQYVHGHGFVFEKLDLESVLVEDDVQVNLYL